MMNWQPPLLGGVIIGIAVSFMLLLNGRVTGISGIINGLIKPSKNDFAWRAFFVAGLICGGIVLRLVNPEFFSSTLPTDLGTTVAAGLLVGFGTVMGGGCTSGHGVCGISRMSVRSLLATIIFILAGVLTVALMRSIGWLP